MSSKWDIICDMVGQYMQKKEEEKRIAEDQAAKDRYWKIPICYDDDDDEESSIPLKDIIISRLPPYKVIMSSVVELVLIPSESEGILDKMFDVPLCDNPTLLKLSKNTLKLSLISNDDSTSSDDDSPYGEDIDYVDASPPNSELISLEVVEIVIPKVGGIDTDILLTIKDDILQISSGSPTSYLDLSLPDYEAFYLDDDHVEEKSSGSTTTHADFSQYDSFIFDLSINPCPPADRSDCYHEEFVGELAHIISPPEEPRVHVPNVLPTHPTLHLDLDFTLSSDSLGSDLVVSFPSGTRNKIFDPGIFIGVQSMIFLSPGEPDDHDLLVNSNNENDDMLGYESEKYSDDEDADGTNHAEDVNGTNHSYLKLVKRGYISFAGNMENLRYFDVDLTFRYLEKSARGKMARSKKVYHHKMGRGGYVFVKEKMIENKEIEADEEPPRGIMWLKGRKEADDKIKEGTLNLDDGTDAMTVVFGKEKGGYARGVGSGVTYKRYFHLPRSRQATDERIELLQTQLDNKRRERQQKDELVKKLSTEMTQKDVLVNKLSNEMTETKGMLSQLMNQLAAQGSSVVVRDKDARIKKKSNGLVTSEKEPVKTVGPKKTPKSRRNGSQDSQSQGNVSPTQELPTASKCKLWHLKKSNIVALGTVYKSAGKQMLHNQALPNDCYKVSIDSSLVDAACIPDVGNNGLKTVKDGVGGFFAWPKNQVVLDEEVTPPTTIQKISDYNSAPKLQSKRKSYVSRETMQRQARTGKSHKSLNYGS
ncbi:hypothetical protein Tco_0993057 [Tanacetum coccineum]|uniref:DUF8039 domain-containing protein n=1 Tax=Tanacetum coccineum TaxID=301880 RepID=A0ABQ5F3U5_9ASTR